MLISIPAAVTSTPGQPSVTLAASATTPAASPITVNPRRVTTPAPSGRQARQVDPVDGLISQIVAGDREQQETDHDRQDPAEARCAAGLAGLSQPRYGEKCQQGDDGGPGQQHDEPDPGDHLLLPYWLSPTYKITIAPMTTSPPTVEHDGGHHAEDLDSRPARPVPVLMSQFHAASMGRAAGPRLSPDTQAGRIFLLRSRLARGLVPWFMARPARSGPR